MNRAAVVNGASVILDASAIAQTERGANSLKLARNHGQDHGVEGGYSHNRIVARHLRDLCVLCSRVKSQPEKLSRTRDLNLLPTPLFA